MWVILYGDYFEQHSDGYVHITEKLKEATDYLKSQGFKLKRNKKFFYNDDEEIWAKVIKAEKIKTEVRNG